MPSFWPAWMRGVVQRVFPTGPSRGLPAHRAFQPVLVSGPPCTQRVLRALVCGRLEFAGLSPVHEGARGIEIFDEYNKGS